MAGRVQESDDAARRLDVVGANVLGDAARFAGGHLGAADVVKQRGLAVVHVAHDGDHGRTRQGLGGLGLHFFVGEGLGVVQRGHHGGVAHFFDDDHGRVLVERLVDGDHLAHLHQRLDDFGCLDGHLVRQLGHGDGFRHMHFQHAMLCGRCLGGLLAVAFAAAAFWAATPVVAAHAAGSIAARGNAFFLARLARPAGGQLGGFDFLAAACGRAALTGRADAACLGRLAAVFGRFSRFLGAFGLLGHQHFARLVHHAANGFGFSHGLAAALFLLALAGGFFFRAGLGGFCYCGGRCSR